MHSALSCSRSAVVPATWSLWRDGSVTDVTSECCCCCWAWGWWWLVWCRRDADWAGWWCNCDDVDDAVPWSGVVSWRPGDVRPLRCCCWISSTCRPVLPHPGLTDHTDDRLGPWVMAPSTDIVLHRETKLLSRPPTFSAVFVHQLLNKRPVLTRTLTFQTFFRFYWWYVLMTFCFWTTPASACVRGNCFVLLRKQVHENVAKVLIRKRSSASAIHRNNRPNLDLSIISTIYHSCYRRLGVHDVAWPPRQHNIG